MTEKDRMMSMLRQVFEDWEGWLGGLTPAAATTPAAGQDWSVREVVVHLHGWQEISIARVEAAISGWEPVLPEWARSLPKGWEENVDPTNASIQAFYRSRAWAEVHTDWKDGFTRFISLCDAVPLDMLEDKDRFSWLPGFPLMAVLRGSYLHHVEHLEKARELYK